MADGPNPDAAQSDKATIKKEGEALRRRRAIVEGTMPISKTHEIIRQALLSQGEIHWDEHALESQSGGQLPQDEWYWKHYYYLIEEYTGDGCRVEIKRRLFARSGDVPDSNDVDDRPDTVTSRATVVIDMAAVRDISAQNFLQLTPIAHAEDLLDYAGLVAVDLRFLGGIEVDGQPMETIGLPIVKRDDGFDDGTFDEIEAWFSHLRRLCRYPPPRRTI